MSFLFDISKYNLLGLKFLRHCRELWRNLEQFIKFNGGNFTI